MELRNEELTKSELIEKQKMLEEEFNECKVNAAKMMLRMEELETEYAEIDEILQKRENR